MWPQVVEAKMRVDLLEVELTSALKRSYEQAPHRGGPLGAILNLQQPRGLGSFWVFDEVCLWGYNFGFNMCEFIMQGCYLEVGEATELLIPLNATLEEIINSIRQR